MANKEEMQNGDVVAQDIRETRAVSEFLELKEEINGKSRDEVMEMYDVLHDSKEDEDSNDNYLEISAGCDCIRLSYVYVDFDENWENAEVSYFDATVLNEEMIGETVSIKKLIESVKERKLENLCEWLIEHKADYASVYREGEDNEVAGIEFTLSASDGHEGLFFADLRTDNVEELILNDEWDWWFKKEITTLYDNYDVNEEVMYCTEKIKKFGVRKVLECIEEIDKKLEELYQSA